MMSAAAPVHTHPVQASAPLRAKGAAKSGEGSAPGSATAPVAESGKDFGKYFREQAGPAIQPIALTGQPGAGTKPASGVSVPASADPAPSLPASGIPGSAPPETPLSDSPQSLILEQLQSRLHGTTVEVAAADGPQSGGEAGALAAAPDKAPDLDETKIAKTSLSMKGAQQKGKGEKAAQPQDAASALPVPAGPPAAATLAVTPAVTGIPPLKPIAVILEKAQSAGANSRHAAGSTPTGGKTAPASSATPTIASAADSAQRSQAGVSNQSPVTGLLLVAPSGQVTPGDEKDASVAGNSDASSRNSSPAAPSSHAGHISAIPATPKPASLSAAPAAALHSDAPSSTLPHVTLGPPATTPSAAGSSSPTGATVLYDRIDQGLAPVVLHSGAQHVSVGVHDPELGWVEIQTQNSGGRVDAMLVSSSGQTHDSLAAQLPALAQFLEQRDVRVGTLAVQQPAQAATGGSGQGGGTGTGGGMGSGTGYSGNGGASARHSGSANSGGRSTRQPSAPPTARPGGISGPTPGTDSGGEASLYRPLSYISVRA